MQNNCTKKEYEIFKSLGEPYRFFQKKEIIGKGNYGFVYRGIHNKTNQEVAIKVMKVETEDIPTSIKEIIFLKEFSNHVNICKFYGAFVIPCEESKYKQYIWLVMEYCPLGNAKNLIDNYKISSIPEDFCTYIIKGIVYGLKYLHQNNIVHRDIKSPNILFDPKGIVKISDFGSCAVLPLAPSDKNLFIGTFYWMAPEVIHCRRNTTQNYDSKCDTWSLGITCVELSEGRPPNFETTLPSEVLEIISSDEKYKYKINILRSLAFKNFIKKCLNKDFNKRPTVEALSHHPLIENFKKKESKTYKKFFKKLIEFSFQKSL